MTIEEALQICDHMKPNDYQEADKIRWLSDLDGLIKKEILDVHKDNHITDFAGYTDKTEKSTVLLVEAPYSDVYIKYLFAQIDFNNAEFIRYNNSADMFNMAYRAYANYYKRTHTPLQKSRIRV